MNRRKFLNFAAIAVLALLAGTPAPAHAGWWSDTVNAIGNAWDSVFGRPNLRPGQDSEERNRQIDQEMSDKQRRQAERRAASAKERNARQGDH